MSKELLLSVKFKSETIKLNGENYEVREMTAKNAAEYESSLFKIVNNKPVYNTKDAKNKLVLSTLFKNNEQVFGKNDIGLVGQLPASMVNKIFEAATKINQLDPEENEKN